MATKNEIRGTDDVGFVATPRPEHQSNIWDVPSCPDAFFFEMLSEIEIGAVEESSLTDKIVAFGGPFLDLAEGEQDELSSDSIPFLLKAVDSMEGDKNDDLQRALTKIKSVANVALTNGKGIIFWF